ncbi:MAG: branched-chain amino acid ABC transporter ATP-binding protein/permease [Euzebyales bacterium]|nr:branched-chain amino acid ABC transporter ATP-binding protein/permease [Euzebyales bacterium]
MTETEAAGVLADDRSDGGMRMTTGGAAQRRRLRRDFAGLAVLIAGVVAFPLLASSQLVFVAVFAGVFALAALGLSLLLGLAGQISLGHAGFLAIGAYTSAILTTRYQQNALLASVVAVGVTMVTAAAVGTPILRLRGHYLALATLGFGIIVAVVANQWDFTGGQSGIFGIRKVEFNGRVYDDPSEQFWLVWAAVVGALILARNLASGRVGRALGAVNDSEVAAETLGVDTFRLRLQVFVLSAGLAAVAGSCYAHVVGVVNAQAASFLLSVELLLMAVIGGLASVWGAVVGAIFVRALSEALTAYIPRVVPGASGEYQLIGFGVVLVVAVIFLPGGFVSAGTRLAGRLGARRRPRTPVSGGGVTAASDHEATGEAAPLLLRAGRPAVGTAVLLVRGLELHFGGVRAVQSVDLEVRTGEIVGLIGPNGAGKTTLFNVVSGVLPPTAGTVEVGGARLEGRRPHAVAAARAARTFQNLEIFSSMTVVGNVAVGRHLRSRAGVVAGALALPARAEERAIDAEARRLVELLGLGDVADSPAADLPFGRQRLVEIARALATEPDLLLLDEPMAGLSAAERAGLAGLLRRLRAGGMAILLVEHDIEAVMALADRVAVLDDGRRIAYGAPSEVSDDPAVIEAYLGADAEQTTLGGPA